MSRPFTADELRARQRARDRALDAAFFGPAMRLAGGGSRITRYDGATQLQARVGDYMAGPLDVTIEIEDDENEGRD